MLERVRKMKNKKGFTLVELIVVLVILAILIALLVPALTGYIDKANKKKVAAEARMLLTAVQTEASNAFGKDTITGAIADKKITEADAATTEAGGLGWEIQKLADDVKGKYVPATTTFSTDATGKVIKLVYKGSKYDTTYSVDSNGAASWTEPTKTSTP